MVYLKEAKNLQVGDTIVIQETYFNHETDDIIDRDIEVKIKSVQPHPKTNRIVVNVDNYVKTFYPDQIVKVNN